MSMLKKFLRGVYFFCVGVKQSTKDLCEWFTSNNSVPRPLRNGATLCVLTLALVGGSSALVYSVVGAANGAQRELPTIQTQFSEPEKAETVSSSVQESQPQSVPAQEQQASEQELPQVDALVSATRYTPIAGDQLAARVKESKEKYYKKGNTGSTEKVNTKIPSRTDKLKEWKQVNSDVRAWIKVPNTNIDLPVVYHTDTNYYLHRNIYKAADRNGVIWLDADVKFNKSGSFNSQNVVMYGHNWTNCWRPVRMNNPNDVMFAQLAMYDNAEFAAENPYIQITTEDGDHTYQVFTAFYTKLDFSYNYCDGERVPGIISKAKKLSIHDFDVEVGSKDKIITLSTCTRILGQQLGENQRFVVMAKKIS